MYTHVTWMHTTWPLSLSLAISPSPPLSPSLPLEPPRTTPHGQWLRASEAQFGPSDGLASDPRHAINRTTTTKTSFKNEQMASAHAPFATTMRLYVT